MLILTYARWKKCEDDTDDDEGNANDHETKEDADCCEDQPTGRNLLL